MRDLEDADDDAGALSGNPLVALSSKNLDGLKKLPYVPDHFLRLAYMCFGPTRSAQNTIPPR